MQYRPEIDGLRAVAVLPVMFFHAGFLGFGGGYVGVDVFFVISGYLITTNLVEGLRTGQFSIADFYERRARRILPALFFIVLLSLIAAWFLMFPRQFAELGRSAISVSLFVSNFHFWTRSGYFAGDAEQQALLHTWSLAVEEQYYILFPIFLLLFWRTGTKTIFWLIAAATIISFGLSEWASGRYADANFFLTPTRAWELLAGALCALSILKRGVRKNDGLALAGLGAIGLSVFGFSEHTPFPGIYAALPVGGAMLVILFGAQSTFTARALSLRPMVAVGLVSYSAYLWHQPLFAFTRIHMLNEPSHLAFILLCIVTLALAGLTWRYVEQPFRHRSSTLASRNVCFAVSVAGLMAMGVMGWSISHAEGFPGRVSAEVRAVLETEVERNPYRSACHLGGAGSKFAHPLPGCSDYLSNGSADVLMLGDSHLDAISYELQESLKSRGLSSYSVSYSGCIALPGFYRVDADNSHQCDRYTRSMLAFARAIGVKAIVHMSRLSMYWQGNRYDNGEGGVESGTNAFVDVIGRKEGGRRAAWNSYGRRERVLRQARTEIGSIADEFNLVLVMPVPEPGWHVPQYLAKRIVRGEPVDRTSTSLDSYLARNKRLIDMLRTLDQQQLIRFDPAINLCDEVTGRCTLVESKLPLYRDDNHLSNRGALRLVPSLTEAIESSFASDEK